MIPSCGLSIFAVASKEVVVEAYSWTQKDCQ